MDQEIGFCTAADGVGVAHAVSGTGPPLVKTAHFLTHVELDWESPLWRAWWDELGSHHRLIRFDQRGTGLSDREVGALGLDAWVSDLEAVVDAHGLDQFPLFGMSQGGPVAIAYAAKHPERVTHLILYGAYVRGAAKRPGFDADQAIAMRTLVETGWGKETPAFRRMFATLMVPGATTEQLTWFDDLQRASATGPRAAELIEVYAGLDVSAAAASLDVPTLVMHSKGDARVPFEEGRQLAAVIPGARLVPLESDNHILLPDEPSFARLHEEIRRHLGVAGATPPATATPRVRPGQSDLTERESDVLRLVTSGKRNGEIARELFLSEKTVRNYVSNIMTKLDVHGRGELVALGHRLGMGPEG